MLTTIFLVTISLAIGFYLGKLSILKRFSLKIKKFNEEGDIWRAWMYEETLKDYNKSNG